MTFSDGTRGASGQTPDPDVGQDLPRRVQENRRTNGLSSPVRPVYSRPSSMLTPPTQSNLPRPRPQLTLGRSERDPGSDKRWETR